MVKALGGNITSSQIESFVTPLELYGIYVCAVTITTAATATATPRKVHAAHRSVRQFVCRLTTSLLISPVFCPSPTHAPYPLTLQKIIQKCHLSFGIQTKPQVRCRWQEGVRARFQIKSDGACFIKFKRSAASSVKPTTRFY